QRCELQPREELVQLPAVGLTALERVEVDVHFQIALDARQLSREKRLLSMLFQLLPLGRLQLIEVFVNVLQRAELRNERLGSLLTDSRYARDVVDGIAPDGHHVDDFFGR